MLYIHSEETLDIPDDVKVSIKARNVTVEGPRGPLQLPNWSLGGEIY
jgi:large subunit ribosomal protein L9e